MDVLLIAIAFLFGLVARQFRLPPLVGFLVAGFVLQTLGKEGGETLRSVSDLGVTLLLFSIGLKLRVRSLMRPEIWGSTTLHAGFVVLLFAPLLYGAAFFLRHRSGSTGRQPFSSPLPSAFPAPSSP